MGDRAGERTPAETRPLVEQTPAEAEEEIRELLDVFRAALSARDDASAVARVSARTLERYATIHGLALKALRKTELERIRAAPLSDQVIVALTLDRLGADEIAVMDGVGLLRLAIANGWVGTHAAELEMGALTLHGVLATAPMLQAGEETGAVWRFVREQGAGLNGGAWRVDLTAQLDFVNARMVHEARHKGMRPEELLQQVVASQSGVLSWREVADEACGFRAEMPGPTTTEAHDGQRRMHADRGAGGLFTISCGPVRGARRGAAYLDEVVAGLLASTGGELMGVADAAESAHATRELQVRLADGQLLTAHLVVTDTQSYQLLVVGPASQGVEGIRRFFDGFEVAGP